MLLQVRERCHLFHGYRKGHSWAGHPLWFLRCIVDGTRFDLVDAGPCQAGRPLGRPRIAGAAPRYRKHDWRPRGGKVRLSWPAASTSRAKFDFCPFATAAVCWRLSFSRESLPQLANLAVSIEQRFIATDFCESRNNRALWRLVHCSIERTSMFERLLEPGCTESPACQCGGK
jgi:hypothetical protein